MTDMLIRVMALPRVLQRALAVSLLAICVILAAATVIYAYAGFNKLRANIADGRSNLARFELLLKQKPSDLAPVPVEADSSSNAFLDGGNDAVIQAGLQARVNASAASQNVMVASVGNTLVLMIDGVRYVGVRADLQGTLTALNNTLFELETAQPPLIIREATMRSTNVMGSEGLTAPLELAAEIVVYGATRPQTVAPVTGTARP